MSDPKAQDEDTVHYEGPAGGWDSRKGIARIYGKQWATPAALETLGKQNKPGGFMCVSCAWTKPKHSHAFECCENGAKAPLWERTSRRCPPGFFTKHSIAGLQFWSDCESTSLHASESIGPRCIRS